MLTSTRFKKRPVYRPSLVLVVTLLLLACITGGLYMFRSPDTTNLKAVQKTQVVKQQSDLLAGQWQYLPGSSKQKDGLHITATNAAIVEQDGSGGQANPPINLFGTHLAQLSDFKLQAQIGQRHGDATLQLYGQTPIIADEFRIERKSVEITLTDTTVRLRLWDGSGQSPVVTQSWPYSPKTSTQLTVSSEHGQLTLGVDGTTIGSVASRQVFSDQSLWFGMSASNSWVLGGLQATPLNGTTLATADSSTQTVPTVTDGLQQLAAKKRPGFTIGAAMALGPAVSDPAYAQVAFGGNFGALTTENALKWQFVHPQPNLYTFQEGDALVALAKKNGMAVHGHTLVFGEANPRWVQDLPTATDSDKAKVKQVMLDHIRTVVGHYKGQIATWDVVNEPLADYDAFDSSNGHILRQHKWYQAMGESYIGEAFNAAHATDPSAKLFMNEYGLEEDGDRWDAFLQLVTKLKSEGVPINGVGFQTHVYDASDRIDGNVLTQHMRQLAKLGLVSRVSENDVYSDDGQGTQAQQYGEVLRACLSQTSCIGYTTWGVSDRYDTYKDDNGTIAYGQDFLWDSSMLPTPSVAKLQSILK